MHFGKAVWSHIERAALAAALSMLLVAQTGCPHTVRPTGDETADCAVESGKDIFYTLVPRISTIIATGPDYGTVAIELAKLAAEYGVDLVTCAVDAVRNRNAKSAAVASGEEKQLHERSESWAEQWLAEKGAQIKEGTVSTQ